MGMMVFLIMGNAGFISYYIINSREVPITASATRVRGSHGLVGRDDGHAAATNGGCRDDLAKNLEISSMHWDE